MMCAGYRTGRRQGRALSIVSPAGVDERVCRLRGGCVAAALPMLLLVGLALGLSGCGESSQGNQYGVVAQARDAGSDLGPTTEQSGQVAWEPPGELLGCGDPCSDQTVDAVGRCAFDVAARCVDGVVVCDDCGADARSCVEDPAGARCQRDCEGTQVCPPGGECYTQVCCPDARWCDRGAMARCNELGTEMTSQACFSGLDCSEGQCVPAQSMIHVLFDTSGSMNWSPAGATIDPPPGDFPACDQPASPQSRLGISKRAFHALFSDLQYDQVLFALQRFPQRLHPDLFPRCPGGAYIPQDQLTDSRFDFQAGDWFEASLSETLVVPFPRRASESNRDVLAQWLDFEESSIFSDTACSAHAQCPGGLCTIPGGDGRCRYFENPELRAPESATPLGTSLFYAGEYLRTMVVVEGKACRLDADCGAAHHFCSDGKCHDPNRFCRQRSVVVFTDGQDTSSPDGWFQPVVQARRFRAGVSCSGPTDCGSGFDCVQGACQPTGTTDNPCQLVGSSCAPDRTAYPDAAAVGANRLYDANGDAIDITVHVVDGAGGAADIAAYGGGLWIRAQLANPTSLIEEIRPVIDWKDPDFCPQQ